MFELSTGSHVHVLFSKFVGRLILHLTKDSYTRLGLDGKLSRHNKYGGEKYGIRTGVLSCTCSVRK